MAIPDGLPAVSTFAIWRTLREAGYTFQRTRTWCPTGSAVRRRKAGVVAGVWEASRAWLREEVRLDAGRSPHPLPGRVNSQTVKTTP